MFGNFYKNIGFERDNSFVIKVLLLCIPSVIVFMVLSLYKLVEPLTAIASLAGIVLFNIILLFPLSVELQKIKRYMTRLASDDAEKPDENLTMSEQETKELVNAINNMHRFWSEKNNLIKAKSISRKFVSKANLW